MRILLFYQYYHNYDCAATGRHYALLKEWARRNDVHVISTDAWYRKRISHEFEWAPPGVQVFMPSVAYENEMSAMRRGVAFLSYAARAIAKGVAVLKPDVIVGTSTPLTAAWAAQKVAALRRVPWVFEVRDLWPDFPIEAGAIKNPWLIRRLRRLERRLYRSAAAVVALSPDMAQHVSACGTPEDKIHTLVNGTNFDLLDRVGDAHVAALRADHGLDGRFVVLYAGTFGRVNDTDTLQEVAARMADRSDVQFIFAGDGICRRKIEAQAQEQANVTYLGALPRPDMLGWMKLADVSVVSFVDLPVLASNSPAKFFDALGAGTPVIVTNRGWTHRFVSEKACGWYVEPSNAEGLQQKISALVEHPSAVRDAGTRGASAARLAFDRSTIAQEFEQILATVAGHPAT